ncbi:MAG: DNA-binding protein [Candidatus Chloroheliales bacterium]|nr:MAG: DNA-binding protein [Chloroflexota bacterium]
MNILLDTNVLLDLLLEREPFVEDAKQVFQAKDAGRINIYITANSLTDVFYIGRRTRVKDMSGEKALQEALTDVVTCLKTLEICTVDRYALEQAATLTGSDFEDNLQAACAVIASLDAIVTRDEGFSATTVPVLSPADLMAKLAVS